MKISPGGNLPSDVQPASSILPLPPRTQVRDDGAFERRATGKVVDVRRDAVEDEPQDVRVAVVALAHEREPALETEDVRVRLEVLGKLRIEQPRRADRKTRRRPREMTREEGLGLSERVVARLGGERTALGDMDPERVGTFRKGFGDMRGADAHAVELETAQLIERAAEVQREPAARA